MIAWGASVAVFALVMSITPGPNNVLLASSGVRFGLRRSLPQLLGIVLGVSVMIAVTASGLTAVLTAAPWLQLLLKIGGSAYLLWLAWRLLRTSGIADAVIARPLGVWRSAAFQFVNPKAWAMTVGLVSGFLAPGAGYATSTLAAMAIFAAVQVPSCGVWAVFGAGLRRWLSTPRALSIVNRALAGATAATVLLLWI
ncbi:MAG: LysE family translocator [Microbacterium sp.]|uniref:LysE family translocator n=1 Tax=Microbacterium sp. TaxID=51671 RepID=UPI0039E45515